MKHDPNLFEGTLASCGYSTSRDCIHQNLWCEYDNVYYRLDDIPTLHGVNLFIAQGSGWYSDLARLEFGL